MTAPRKKGVRFADPNDCVRDKVCSAGVPRAGIAAHHVETTAGSGQSHEVGAWSSRGHTISHLHVSWNCRLQDFEAHCEMEREREGTFSAQQT